MTIGVQEYYRQTCKVLNVNENSRTSSAENATLGYTRLARLIIHADAQLRLESKTEPSVAKKHNYATHGGGHRTEKAYSGRRVQRTLHTF